MRKAIVLALAAALCAPLAASAALSLYGSYWDTDDLGEGFGLGARFSFSVLPKVQVDLGGSFYQEFERRVVVNDQSIDLDLRMDVIPLDAGLSLNMGRRGGFYLGAGATLFLLDSDFADIDDEFGYYGLVGLRLGRGLFVEAIYREVDGTFEGISFDDLNPDIEVGDRVGVDLTGFGLNVGVRF